MTMENLPGVIWMDGELVPWQEAKIHVLTHTLHYGMGTFEGIRAYPADKGCAIFRLQAHIERFFRSTHILNMLIPFDPETIKKACISAVRENGLGSAYIRPLCFYGPEGMGLHVRNLKVHVIVAAWLWGAYLGREGQKKGVRVKTSSYTRHHVNTTMCKAKANGNYLNSMLALQEAVECGYDEALLLDSEGFVTEGTGENIFITRDGVLYTPELTAVLEGITRHTIFILAQEQGLEIKEKRLTRDEVYTADEAFFTGTAAEITPIRELDGRIIGTGERGSITKMLQEMYFDQTHGRREQFPEWLDYVEEHSSPASFASSTDVRDATVRNDTLLAADQGLEEHDESTPFAPPTDDQDAETYDDTLLAAAQDAKEHDQSKAFAPSADESTEEHHDSVSLTSDQDLEEHDESPSFAPPTDDRDTEAYNDTSLAATQDAKEHDQSNALAPSADESTEEHHDSVSFTPDQGLEEHDESPSFAPPTDDRDTEAHNDTSLAATQDAKEHDQSKAFAPSADANAEEYHDDPLLSSTAEQAELGYSDNDSSSPLSIDGDGEQVTETSHAPSTDQDVDETHDGDSSPSTTGRNVEEPKNDH